LQTPSQRRYTRVPANAIPAISLDRTRAADDTDGATRQTVQKMCELIRDSANDPRVQQCAAYAKKHFSCGSNDPGALAWGVFWYVKHCVKFRSDEGTMLQIGERNQQDLLIAPAVLVRMDKPSEDCDGFTMLTAAMLTILGVPVLPTTVATDLDDKQRWSHIFVCAIINGRVMPLDTSHGKAPGWMVPRDRINRFQTWTLDGKPADVKIPNFQGLHGYVGRGLGARGRLPTVIQRRGRGFGQVDLSSYFDSIGTDIGSAFNNFDTSLFGGSSIGGSLAAGDIVSTSTGSSTAPYFAQFGIDPTTTAQVAPLVQAPAGYTGPTILKPTATAPTPPTGYQYATIINSAGNQLAKILTVASGGSSQTLANGNQLLFGAGSSGNLMGSLSSSTGLSSSTLMIAGVALLAFVLLKK
jgi:hypothetical protein